MSDMKPPLIECDTCHGTGRAPLSELLTETLWLLGHTKCTAADLTPKHLTVNAINNRLESLRALGFVQRQRRGKFWVYSATPRPPKRDAVPARRSLK